MKNYIILFRLILLSIFILFVLVSCADAPKFEPSYESPCNTEILERFLITELPGLKYTSDEAQDLASVKGTSEVFLKIQLPEGMKVDNIHWIIDEKDDISCLVTLMVDLNGEPTVSSQYYVNLDTETIHPNSEMAVTVFYSLAGSTNSDVSDGIQLSDTVDQ